MHVALYLQYSKKKSLSTLSKLPILTYWRRGVKRVNRVAKRQTSSWTWCAVHTQESTRRDQKRALCYRCELWIEFAIEWNVDKKNHVHKDFPCFFHFSHHQSPPHRVNVGVQSTVAELIMQLEKLHHPHRLSATVRALSSNLGGLQNVIIFPLCFWNVKQHKYQPNFRLVIVSKLSGGQQRAYVLTLSGQLR